MPTFPVPPLSRPSASACRLPALLALLALTLVWTTVALAQPAAYDPNAMPGSGAPMQGSMGGPMAGGPIQGPMGVAPPPSVETTKLAKTRALRTVRLPDAARPEIVAEGGKAHVLYLDPKSRSFMLTTYDASLKKVLANPRPVVVPDATWGHPTDIRAVRDGDALVAFFEMANDQAGTASLWGLRLDLSPTAPESAPRIVGPLAQAPYHYRAQTGEELLDDPAPLVTPDAVYVVTRLKDRLAQGGRATLRVRELTRDLASVRRVFDLDLSGVLAGGARTVALVPGRDGGILLVAPTTTGASFAPIDLTIPSDMALVSLSGDWRVLSSRILLTGRGNALLSPMGLTWRGQDLLLTYRDIVHTPAPMTAARSMLAVFGPGGAERERIALDETPFGGQRPRVPRTTVAVGNGLVYVGGETQLAAYLQVFDKLR